MPNYYIQATRGHFNPLSFDELVKPLNMYKEYYDENEKAVTEMRSQADLWDEIMKSEGDTDLANKYNQYSQGLNDAAQQLSNGMSYNLRKQIQDLRAKSAIVKQIENAYTLRAKDIDTYNQLMMQDPSRIGAFDPSQRRLQEYMQGPVTNEYGVSGDELYKKAAIAGKAMTLRSKTQSDSEDKNGVITRTTQIGFNNNNINEMLNDENSVIYQEADKILKAQGITPETSYYNAAKQEVVKGIVDGIYYDKEITYHNEPRGGGNGGNGRTGNVITQTGEWNEDHSDFIYYPNAIGSIGEAFTIYQSKGTSKHPVNSYYVQDANGNSEHITIKSFSITDSNNKQKDMFYTKIGNPNNSVVYFLTKDKLNNQLSLNQSIDGKTFDLLYNNSKLDPNEKMSEIYDAINYDFVNSKIYPLGEVTKALNLKGVINSNMKDYKNKEGKLNKENYDIINVNGRNLLFVHGGNFAALLYEYDSNLLEPKESNNNLEEENNNNESTDNNSQKPTQSDSTSIEQQRIDSLNNEVLGFFK